MGCDELIAAFNGQDEPYAESNNTGDEIEVSDLEDTRCMEDFDQREEGCFDQSYAVEDCESGTKLMLTWRIPAIRGDLDYIEAS
jgi:hypothetical protein